MSAMIRKTISLPPAMAAFINARVASGLYGNDSEYFRELVRRDQERAAQETSKHAFEALIADSIASGHTDRSLREILDDARRRARRDMGDGL